MNRKLSLLALTTAATAVLLAGCQNPGGRSNNTAAGISFGAAVDVKGKVADSKNNARNPQLKAAAPQTFTVKGATAPATVQTAFVASRLGCFSAPGKWDWEDGWIWVPGCGPLPPYSGGIRDQSNWYGEGDGRGFFGSDFGQRIQGDWYRGDDGWPAKLPARAVGWPQGNWRLGSNGWQYVGGYWGD